MQAARIDRYGEPPALVDRPLPVAGPGQTLIRVEAVGIHRVVRSRAAGRHYTSTGALPLVPGVDGVGRTPDGTRVWFVTMASETDGSLAEYVVVADDSLVPVPAGLDAVTVAAAVNPLIAAWMSVFVRGGLERDGHLVVLGATGAAGSATCALARGVAARVTAVGRDAERLEQLRADGLADDVVALDHPDTEAALTAAARTADVCVDYVWGSVAEQFWAAAEGAGRAHGHPLTHVETGTMAGPDAVMPGALLRAVDLRLLGSAPGAYSFQSLAGQVPALLHRMAADGLSVPARVFTLDQLSDGWAHTGADRTVFRMA